ncbi:MAG: paraquat-inducible protein A [Pseudomonadota bacterium]
MTTPASAPPPLPATAPVPVTGRALGWARCSVCSTLSRATLPPTEDDDPSDPPKHPPCASCGAAVHTRRPDSLARTSALALAAAVLYLPANLLPVMHTESLLGAQDDTIMSGVMVLLQTGSWPLALVVFVASVVVPMLKLLALLLLVVSTHRRTAWRPLQRTRLYRLTETVGRWSMLDIYVITVLVGLVQFQTVATVLPGPGALAFAAVVVLTMLAAQAFDPRLIWDAATSDDTND